jgi:AcrR family transcriptional regulator
MARPVSISEDTILEAARALFVEKGPRATTAEIAKRAGVSEGILFKRYGSKAALHRAAMSSGIVSGWIEKETRARGPLRTQEDFERLIRWHVEVLRDVVPMVIMAWSSRSNPDELPRELTGRKPPPLVAIRALTDLLEEEMLAGHLVRREAGAVARILIGAVWHFVFLGHVFKKPSAGFDEDTFVSELARMVFGDLNPGSAGSAGCAAVSGGRPQRPKPGARR